jgi:uncharacterized protein YbjT (DUF2867 family)
LHGVAWRDDVEIVAGSIGGPLDEAMKDIDVAVFLVHRIGQGSGWAQEESRDAENFRRAAQRAGVRRIVYLGGMGADQSGLSEHLSSRQNVGRTLSDGPIPVCELRAAMIIGSGSASFEMLRYLVEVLPIMVTPKWVKTKCQPIAISDVLDYLMKAIGAPQPFNGVYEIGGPDVVSYAQMMELYADIAGLTRRRLLPVPLLTPRLSSHWVGIVTPVPASLARPLVDSLVNEVVVRDTKTVDEMGPPQRTLREAIQLALGVTERGETPTTFSDADMNIFRSYETDPSWAGGTVLRDVRTKSTKATPEAIYGAVTSLGGSKGWHTGKSLWRVRGIVDRLFGGPGLRRGRRDPSDLRVGDVVDFWRVQDLLPDHFVKLHAEMLLPGDAFLEWKIEKTPQGSLVQQIASYKPRGVFGRLYWLAVAPFHVYIFPGLLRGIVKDALKADAQKKELATTL